MSVFTKPETSSRTLPWAGDKTNYIAVGALAGLAWSASMRGWMVELAREETAFHWLGTFGFILIPGALVGGLLGWTAATDEHETLTRTQRRLLIAAPVVLGVAPLLDPTNVVKAVTTGIGTGGLGVVGLAMLGGWALAGHAKPRTRLVAGIATGVLTLAVGATSVTLGQPLNTPRGAWSAVHSMALVGLLSVASAIPHRLPLR